MTSSSDRLYNLLPANQRVRDAAQGEVLRSLLAIISDELAGVEADIRGLYENWFIETCDDWVVPYIGDLLGVRGLNVLENATFSRARLCGQHPVLPPPQRHGGRARNPGIGCDRLAGRGRGVL